MNIIYVNAKQETLTPPGHLVSPLVCRGLLMSTMVLYCWCHSDGASVLLYLQNRPLHHVVILLFGALQLYFSRTSLSPRNIVGRGYIIVIWPFVGGSVSEWVRECVRACVRRALPCGYYTVYSFCPITFKLHMHIVDNERRNPIDFGSRGQRSRSTLALSV